MMKLYQKYTVGSSSFNCGSLHTESTTALNGADSIRTSSTTDEDKTKDSERKKEQENALYSYRILNSVVGL